MRHVGVQALACHAGEHSRLKPVLQRFLRNSGEGPQLSRFSFHETDCLAHDLSMLLRQPGISSEDEIAVVRAASAESCAAFPGLILLYDGRPCASLGYSREPSATVVISSPVVLIDATDRVRRDLYDVLLKQTKQLCVDAGFQQMNFLQQDSSVDSVFLRLLADRRFTTAAKILQWELSPSLGSAGHYADLKNSDTSLQPRDDDRAVYRFDITNADADEIREVQTALDATLRSSDDLPNQPRPQAAELLAKWQAMHASIFICWIQGEIAGILSCVECMTTESASEIQKACATESVSELYLSLEYIGVVPEFRRRQLASWLIGQISQLLHEGVRKVTHGNISAVTTVKAFSDAANMPATVLYRSRGFVLAAEMQLWSCILIDSQSGKSVPV